MTATIGLVGQGGRVVFVGFREGEVHFSDVEFHRREVTLMASRNATVSEGAEALTLQREDFERVIALVEAGKVDTSVWVNAGCEIDAIASEGNFLRWKDPGSGVIKAVVSMDGWE